jgi:hypothetical protein
MTVSSPYAARALQHYRTHLPNRFAKLIRPEAFFNDLGQQIATRVGLVEESLIDGRASTGSFVNNFAARQTAKMQAEDEVLREMLPAEEEDDPAGI